MATGTSHNAAFDFYSPFFAAAIITDPDNPASTRFPLWTNLTTDHQVVLAAQNQQQWKIDHDHLHSLSFLTELSVELQLAYLPIITATLAPPYREAIAFLDSPLIEWGRSVLEVQFGYTGGAPDGPILSHPLSGVLLKPEVNLGDQPTITLHAQGIGGFSATRQEGNRTFSRRTRREIIEELAKGPNATMKRNLKIDFSAFGQRARDFDAFGGLIFDEDGQDADDVAGRLLLDEKISYAQGGLTDWMAIWMLVRQSQCWMSLVGDTLHIFPRNSALSAEPKYALRLFDYPRGQLGPRAGCFPILSVSSPTSAVYLPGALWGVTARGVSSKEREPVAVTTTEENAKLARTGKKAIGPKGDAGNPEPNKDTGDGLAQLTGVDPMGPKVLAEQQAAYAEFHQDAMGVKLEAETMLIPDLIPGEVVSVSGVGQRLEGNYAILKATYTVPAFTMKLELISNVGEIGVIDSKLRVALGPVNEKKVEQKNEGKSTVVKKPKKGD